ncbi:recombinase family protein [Calditerricola satsumensis]|uniref:recombinase family protein n=1 Tax=Calditerricola satsumensis TaxID=373054 RepID=UPI001C466CE2|nr:recombinase family protein [Calditerricola satsumensis]
MELPEPDAAVLYARVSTKKQAEAGKLERQVERLRAYAKELGYRVVAEYAERVQDLLAIVTSFSTRIDGARRGRKIRQGFQELMQHVGEEPSSDHHRGIFPRRFPRLSIAEVGPGRRRSPDHRDATFLRLPAVVLQADFEWAFPH